jgi:trimeric autotransporter adhesin
VVTIVTVSAGARIGAVGLLIGVIAAGCGMTGTATERSPVVPDPTSTLADTTSARPTTVTASVPPVPPVPPVPSIPALEATLSVPVGLVFDATGNLYVSQCSSDRSVIDRIDGQGQLTRFAGSGPIAFAGDGAPAISAALGCPVGMAFGPDGALYVADHANNRVRRIDLAGIITTIAGSGPAGVNQGSFSGDGGPAVLATLQEPWDVTFDGEGDLFIADRDNQRIRKVDRTGVISTVAGDGTRRFSGDGGPATSASLASPLGVAFDADGDLLIADSDNQRIRKVDPAGMISTFAGTGTKGTSGDGGPATAAAIDAPNDLAFEAGGALLLSTGSRIRRIDRLGLISTIAGKDGIGQRADGIPATLASFGEIGSLAVDELGNLFMADGLRAVYRIDPKGILTRFAGNGP